MNRLHDFSLLSPNSFLLPSLKSKFTEKNYLTSKIFHFRRPIFNNHLIYKQVFLKASKGSVWYYPRFCRSQRRGPFILTNSVTLTFATRAAGLPYSMLVMLDILMSSKEFWSMSDLILWVIIYDRFHKHFWTPVMIQFKFIQYFQPQRKQNTEMSSNNF